MRFVPGHEAARRTGHSRLHLPSLAGAIAGLVAWAAVPLLGGAWRTITPDA
jgi:hypothetical protein